MGERMKVERWRLNVPPVIEAVVDAAMALHDAIKLGKITWLVNAPFTGHETLPKAFDEACRKAEEVERG